MNTISRKISGFYSSIGKRLLDLTLAFPSFIFLTPVLLIAFFLVRINLGKPAIYKHERPGRNGRPFILYKFRTMTEEKDINGNLLPDEARITKIGAFLRNTSIDELPELWNVLKGDMSLVGPRPLLMEYLYRYTTEQARRHEVKPGITGWAQVNGRNTIKFAERFVFDVWYVDNYSFILDIRILLKTAWKTVKREGINQIGQMEVFKGIKK